MDRQKQFLYIIGWLFTRAVDFALLGFGLFIITALTVGVLGWIITTLSK